MASRKRAFEEDDAVDEVNPDGLAGHKINKTNALAMRFAELDAGAEAATTAPEILIAQVAQEAPRAPIVSASVSASASASALAPASAPTPTPVYISEDMSKEENEGSYKVCLTPLHLIYPLVHADHGHV